MDLIDATGQIVYVGNYLSARYPQDCAHSHIPVKSTVQAPSGIKDLVSYRLHVLANLSARWAQARYAQRFGLKLLEWRAMALLGGYAPQSLNQLARSAGLEKSYASRTVAGLVGRKLVASAPDDRDGRGKLFALTRPGKALYRRVFRDANERSGAWLSVLSRQERAAFMGMLGRLTEQARALEAKDKDHTLKRKAAK